MQAIKNLHCRGISCLLVCHQCHNAVTKCSTSTARVSLSMVWLAALTLGLQHANRVLNLEIET